MTRYLGKTDEFTLCVFYMSCLFCVFKDVDVNTRIFGKRYVFKYYFDGGGKTVLKKILVFLLSFSMFFTSLLTINPIHAEKNTDNENVGNWREFYTLITKGVNGKKYTRKCMAQDMAVNIKISLDIHGLI